jgi:hypothetical protein
LYQVEGIMSTIITIVAIISREEPPHVSEEQKMEIRTPMESSYLASLKPCKLPILYIEDDGAVIVTWRSFRKCCAHNL